MFRNKNDNNSVQVSLRTIDGKTLIGTISLGASAKLESLLCSDAKFIEFVSKKGQQRFIAHHQIASVEPLASTAEPSIASPVEDLEPFTVLGLEPSASLAEAMAAFSSKANLYTTERWTGPDIPFEFSRFASQKMAQLNTAFTAAKAAIQSRQNVVQARPQGIMFGSRAVR